MSPRVPRFSERVGATAPPILQIAATNDTLRASIWNLFDTLVNWDKISFESRRRISDGFALDFFKVPIYKTQEFVPRDWLYRQFEQLPWHGAYDFLEFVIANCEGISRGSRPSVLARAAQILEQENAGYRYINGRLEPITNKAEVEEVEAALKIAERFGLSTVHAHLDSALASLAQRPNPDARNAIKEAILAIEATSKLLTGVEGGGIDAALEALVSRANLRPALKKAFAALYGDASGPHGVRHAMLNDAGIDVAEARFFVIACSAFINFVVVKASAAGLLKPAS